MRLVYIFIGIIFIAIVSCSSSKSVLTQEELATFEAFVKEKNFRMEFNWASPQSTIALQQVFNSINLPQTGNTANSINLIGNNNFLAISGDSIFSYLPYFGERQMNVNYGGGDSTIQFEGILEDLETVKNKDNSYTLKFKAKSKGEGFNGFLKLRPSLKGELTLNGSSRFAISYIGQVVDSIAVN